MKNKNKQNVREELLKYGPPKCKSDICDNKVEFDTRKNNWKHYCSWKCRGYFNSKKSRDKAKSTYMEKYGVESQFHSEVVKEKIRKTNLEKYGVENVFENQDVKEKIRKTNLEKYGVENVFENQDVKEKIRKTNLEKYGVETPSKNIDIRQKQKKTMVEKYGVEYPMQSPDIRTKTKLNNIQKYGRESPAQAHLSETIMSIIKDPVKLKQINDLMPVPLIAKTYGGSPSLYIRALHGFGISPKVHYFSTGEIEVYNFMSNIIDANFIKQRDKKLIDSELDILVEGHSLAIEYNGLYWHCESAGITKDYHLNKTIECEQRNIELLHIFDNEWKQKCDIYKSIIVSKLNKSFRKSARKLTLKEVDAQLEMQFLNKNHLQGYVKSNICYGLFEGDTLISLMSFGKSRYNKKYEFELLRYCCLLNTTVIGGAKKLFTNFIRKHSPSSIISYCHRHLFTGKIYETIGMKFSHYTKPSYWYTNDYDTLHSRIKFQKHKLKNILEQYDESLSEVQNMKNNGYDRIWDCGNSVWSWQN
mgnify:CR=1 FL=1